MVFAGKDPVSQHWWQCTDAGDAVCAEVWAQRSPGAAFCNLDSSQWEWTDKSLSIISSFGLTCHRAILSQLVNSAFFVGYLIGSGLIGSLADQHGRRPMLLASLVFATVATVLSALSPNYGVYLVSRVLTGIGAAGQSLVAYLVATESIGPAWRGAAGVGVSVFFVVGEFVLVLIAFLAQPWRLICWATVGLGVLNVGLLVFTPESPRWLLAKGRDEEAYVILQRIADGNGTRLPFEPIASGAPRTPSTTPPTEPPVAPSATAHNAAATVEGAECAAGGAPSVTADRVSPSKQAPQQASPAKASLGNVLSDRHICRRFVVLAYVWCILCMVYYGISLAFSSLPGSIYVTFLIAAVAEVPANVLAAFAIERAGRHNSMAAGMCLGGAACLLCAAVPVGMPQAVMAAVGKFGCAGAFTIASIYTSELFPTLVRSAVLGMENQAARVGGIAAPFIVLLGTQLNKTALPFVVFGATSLVAALAILTLPETLGARMPDNMRDMEAIQSIFSTKAWKRGWRETRKQLFSTHVYKATAQRAASDRLPTIEEGADSLASESGGVKGLPRTSTTPMLDKVADGDSSSHAGRDGISTRVEIVAVSGGESPGGGAIPPTPRSVHSSVGGGGTIPVGEDRGVSPAPPPRPAAAERATLLAPHLPKEPPQPAQQ